MHVKFESRTFQFFYDGYMGVGYFCARDNADHSTDLETGSDCVELIASLDVLWAKCERGEIDKTERDDVFDMIASEYMPEPEQL